MQTHVLNVSIGEYFALTPAGALNGSPRAELWQLRQQGWTEGALKLVLIRAQRRLPECTIWIATYDERTGEVFRTIQAGQTTPESVRAFCSGPLLRSQLSASWGIGPNGIAVELPENAVPCEPDCGRVDGVSTFMRVAAVGHAIGPGLNIMCAAIREARFGRFESPDLLSLEEVSAAITAAVSMRSQRDRDIISAVEESLDRFDVCYFVVDNALRIDSANATAKTLFDNGRYVSQSEGCLSFKEPAAEVRFLDHVRHMTGVSASGDRAIAIPNGDGTEVLTATLSLVRGQADTVLGKPLIAVSIAMKRRAKSIGLEQLRKIGLTQAEAELCGGLLRGQTISEYSTYKGIATATARAHLKRAMMRLGVHRQSDLIRVLLEKF